ncbi:sporulation protein YqfD [Gracilibacillus kekensis]|uniref:Similar to stage IV sporulation protein n=1 Tax=Gracilibacillus kekensis TaxID=1027249 RepID=A0A1M7P3Z2_9BACI|nr:sporulation protein YqfD [Gracilibacillus kekensis]SHN11237.1 similar to stage IV sporulation protein [Gracilibacillus kekensis]
MFFYKKNWLKGYITIEIRGQYPEHFFDMCARYGIPSWDVSKKNTTAAIGKIKLSDLSKLRRIKKRSIYKVYFKERTGLPFLIDSLGSQKPLIIGCMIAFAIIFILSNIVWRIDVSGLDEEIENKVLLQMEEYGLEKGSFQWNIDSPAILQKKLLEDIPELLWVGVKKNGSAFHLEGVEKTTVEKPEEAEVGHLIAAKEGVIVDLFVSKGQPLVRPNDVVYKDDILVSAYLEQQEEEDEGNKAKPLAAEGEVIAKVWYKSEVSIPLTNNYHVLNGQAETKHYLHFSSFLIPFWNFMNPDYTNYQMETEEKNFYFLKWKLPISYIKQTIYQSEVMEKKMEKQEAKTLALEQAKRELLRQLPLDAEITEEKVLHERVESGKVKLTLYYTVLENIAKKQPISQGD